MRQMFRCDVLSTSNDVGVLHHVCELANVPRPIVVEQNVDGLGTQQVGYLLRRPPGSSSQQVPGERRNVGAAFAQGGEANLKRVDSEVEILAELLFLDHRP